MSDLNNLISQGQYFKNYITIRGHDSITESVGGRI